MPFGLQNFSLPTRDWIQALHSILTNWGPNQLDCQGIPTPPPASKKKAFIYLFFLLLTTWPLPASPISLLTLFLSFTLLQPTLAFFTFLFFYFSPQRQLFALVNPALDIVNLSPSSFQLRHHSSEKTSPLYLQGIFFLAPSRPQLLPSSSSSLVPCLAIFHHLK